ncbi:hypothetical protein [Hymenobacter koreensis]|uniref:Uncharacterized protein n=1 Tax=Hymenobacter koreensis TaxID=1084523 RepID=A0ABP8IX71_9BACT
MPVFPFSAAAGNTPQRSFLIYPASRRKVPRRFTHRRYSSSLNPALRQRLLAYIPDVFGWLQAGAHTYLCPNTSYLTAAVHQALVRVVQQETDLSHERASAYVLALRQQSGY